MSSRPDRRRDTAEHEHYRSPEREPWRLSRRGLAVKLAAAGLLVRARGVAWAHKARTPTPDTGRGPFYPLDAHQVGGNDLVSADPAPDGELLHIVGRVFDTEGDPVPGAELVFWQADRRGAYDHPGSSVTERDPGFGYWGATRADAEGAWELRTIVPGHYKINGRYRPNHVHFEVVAEGYRTLPTEMHFDGDPYAATDFVTTLAQHEQLKVSTMPHPHMGEEWSQAEFEIVVRRR